MSNVLEVIKDRRSIRRYKKEPLQDQMLGQILEAVQSTQSWNNSQCWEIIVMDDPEKRDAVQQTVPTFNPAFHAIVDASLLLVLCAKKKVSGYINGEKASRLGDWYMYDLGLATQNLCHSAHELGLGTVVVGLFDHKEVQKIISLPEEYEVVSLIPLGYPGHKGSSPGRKQIGEFVHANQFGTALNR